jgi:LacI family transcriptional regulator
MTVTRVRIVDVAEAAGVSRATVSMVLNGADPHISEGTRLRVREAARELGYTPNAVARSLRTQQTRSVALISDTIATTPFAGQMIAGAQEAAREHGHLLMLVNTGGSADSEAQAIEEFYSHQVDRFIYASMFHRVVDVPSSLPDSTVLLDCFSKDERYAAVIPDDRAGGASAVQMLLDAGHTRIAFIDTDDSSRPIAAMLRYEAYCEVLRTAGIEPDPRWHVHTPVSAGGGRAAISQLLDLPDHIRPTGYFCYNDRIAAGVFTGVHLRGLVIPRDLSVVGYDDQELIAADVDPPLSTVALPHYAMGRWAMEVVLGVRDPGHERIHREKCPVIRRASVGPPPAEGTPSDRQWTTPQ